MTPASLILSAIFYILTGLMAFFSIFGLYILIRYGRSLPLSFVLAAVYCFFFLSILAQSYQTLQSIIS